MDKRYFFIFLAALLLVTGCKKTAKQNISDQVIMPAADTKLAETATSVTHSLHQIAEIEQAALPPQQIIEPPDPASYGMDAIVSIDWNGPLEPLVAKLAAASHYKLRVLGTEPAAPILIAIMKKEVTLADVLRDAGLQAGFKADVVVFPATRTIELRYKAV